MTGIAILVIGFPLRVGVQAGKIAGTVAGTMPRN